MTARGTYTGHQPTEPQVCLLPWVASFAAGLITGAAADLFALWLFAYWMHK